MRGLELAFSAKNTQIRRMTAQAIISSIQKLPSRERRKVYAWVDKKLAASEDELDRKAVAEARAEIAAGAKPRPFEEVCREMWL